MIKYDRHIDGLRGVAILFVVIFHAFPQSLNGGFIGVDIFFVISGYLISAIIFNDLRNETFSFRKFYAARVRRIFPALIVILIFNYAFGYFTLLADEYKQLGKHIAGASIFVSNFILWKESGYFDNSSITKPLLHLWSLAIEWQFYAIWPFLLWAVRKFKTNAVVVIMLFLVLISFYLNWAGIVINPVSSFYSPQTRFWEFACGGLLALGYRNELPSIGTKKSFLQKYVVALLSIAFLLLVSSSICLDKNSEFPGKLALIPVIASLLIIYCGSNLQTAPLSNRLLVWFGLISFPLYLWHWSLLSFAEILHGESMGEKINCAIVALSILLAWLTYRFIEQPIRSHKCTRAMMIWLVISLLIIGGGGYAAYLKDGFKFRYAVKLAGEGGRFDISHIESCKFLTNENYGDDRCNRGTSENGVVNNVVIGDSFANSYAIVLNHYAKSQKFSFVQFGRGQCMSLLNYGTDSCKFLADKAFQYVKSNPSVKVVIIASHWTQYYDRDSFATPQQNMKTALAKTIKAYKDLGKKVVVFLPPPNSYNSRACIPRLFNATINRDICRLSYATALKSDGEYRSYLLPFLRENNIPFFDPFSYFCTKTECKITDGNKIFHLDGVHISTHGGKFLAETARMELDNILNSNSAH